MALSILQALEVSRFSGCSRGERGLAYQGNAEKNRTRLKSTTDRVKSVYVCVGFLWLYIYIEYMYVLILDFKIIGNENYRQRNPGWSNPPLSLFDSSCKLGPTLTTYVSHVWSRASIQLHKLYIALFGANHQTKSDTHTHTHQHSYRVVIGRKMHLTWGWGV